MGFRHYLYVFDKKNLKNLKVALKESNEEDSKVYRLNKVLNATELLELGNYSEEGYALCKTSKKVHGYSDIIKQLHDSADNDETDFNILKREDLLWLIEQYHTRTISYWKQLLGKEGIPIWYDDAGKTVEERCVHYVEDLLRWQEFMINTEENRPWTVQTTWKYEYEMYNLLHILKMVNWKKQLLLIIGFVNC